MNGKSILINLAVFMGVVLVGWFWVGAEISDIRYLRRQIAAQQDTIELERQVIEKLNSINQVLDSQKSNVERLEQAVPPTEERPEVLSMLENLSSQNGLNLVSLDIVEPEEASQSAGPKTKDLPWDKQLLKELKVTTKLIGNYGSLKSWLEAVEKNLRIMDVNKISFKTKEVKTASGEIVTAINPSFDFLVENTTYILKR